MSMYDNWAKAYLSPTETSYYSDPGIGLDPYLFNGEHFRASLRLEIVSFTMSVLGKHYLGAAEWCKVWAAGSGVSYQWAAAREPGDLDVLFGVDWLQFRQSNPDYSGLSDSEIASHMNAQFREALAPFEHHWHGKYDLTVYCNYQTWDDITNLHPYAAYNLSRDCWDVRPDPNPQPGVVLEDDLQRVRDVLDAYDKALDEVQGQTNPAYRTTAAARLRIAAQQAVDLYEEIHTGRKDAFGPDGHGYADPANARWQMLKATGGYAALTQIKDEVDAASSSQSTALYGGPIASASDTLIKSALSRRYTP